MSTEQQTLGGDTVHLSRKLPDSDKSPILPADGARQRYCLECRRRITLGPDGNAENGHAINCSHSSYGVDSNV